MMQFTLNLNNAFQRPIVLLKDFHNISAMLDTGALFPVWTDDESLLTSLLYATYQNGSLHVLCSSGDR